MYWHVVDYIRTYVLVCVRFIVCLLFQAAICRIKPKMIYQRQTVLVDLHLGYASVASVCLIHTFPLKNAGHPWVVSGSCSVDNSLPKLLLRFSG